MPFVKKTSLHVSGVQHYIERTRVKDDFGVIQEKEIDLSTEKLAPVDSFSLKAQIESGVDLRQQNTKILESNISPENLSVIDNTLTALAEQTQTETKPQTETKDGE